MKEDKYPDKYPIKLIKGIDMYGLFDKDGDIIYKSIWIDKVIKEKEKLGFGKIFKFTYAKVGREIKK